MENQEEKEQNTTLIESQSKSIDNPKNKPAASIRKDLTIQDKINIINEYDQSGCYKEVTNKFDISSSHLSSVLKKKDVIVRDYEFYQQPDRKRVARNAKFQEINEKIYFWLLSLDFDVSGSIIQNKAKEIAHELLYTDFRASNGWLECFRKRYGNLISRERRSIVPSNYETVTEEYIFKDVDFDMSKNRLKKSFSCVRKPLNVVVIGDPNIPRKKITYTKLCNNAYVLPKYPQFNFNNYATLLFPKLNAPMDGRPQLSNYEINRTYPDIPPPPYQMPRNLEQQRQFNDYLPIVENPQNNYNPNNPNI